MHSDESDPTASHWTPRKELVREVRASGDVTIFKSVGLGVQDVAIACAVVAVAEKENVGNIIADYNGDD